MTDQVGRIVTAQNLTNIPEGVFVANWYWKGLITPTTFAEKWLTHRDVAVDNLSPHGWLGAGLYLVASGLSPTPQKEGDTHLLSLIYYESKDRFRALREGRTPELAAAWKAVVDDLGRFKHPPGDLWPLNQYPEGMELIAGDYLPQNF